MKTYPNKNEQGELASFDIKHWPAGPSVLARLIEKNLGAEITRRRKRFSFEEVHFTFRYLNHEFVVYEPYGDSDNYTICPVEGSDPSLEVITKIHDGFKQFKPGILGLLTGVLQI